MSKCLTERIKKVLEKLIDQSQTGFVKGRNISEGLRTILDIIEETDISSKAGLLVTIDFQKAFDSLSWDYLFKTLKTFNFGPELMKWIKLCYTDISSCVVNFKQSSAYFSIGRGVRQGDSLSPYLFILAVELMSLKIRNDSEIRGLRYNDEEIKILSYADDTTAILRDELDAQRLFDFLKRFEKLSGLKMNKSKTEGLWLGINKDSDFKPLGIKWQSCIKILGIHISHDKNLILENNFNAKIRKIRQCLNLWKQRDLTIYGKILLLKTFALSQILYVSSVMCVPEKITKELESLCFNFMWSGKQHKVKRNVIVQDYELGGCCMVDFKEMLKVQKIKWVQKYFNNQKQHWKNTMQTLVGVDNLDVFLQSNFIIPKSISPFYNEVLSLWSEIKYDLIEEEEDVLNQYIWYNRYITINKKTLCSKEYERKGILKIGHIVKANGTFKSFEEVKTEFEMHQTNYLFYLSLKKAIPQEWKLLLHRNMVVKMSNECYIYLNKEKYNFKTIDFKKIYGELVLSKLEISKANEKYSKIYNINKEEWRIIYLKYTKLNITNKAKENHFKILHDYIATNKLLYQIKVKDSPRCNFCELYKQDTYHLFFNCLIVKNFWFNVAEWVFTEYHLEMNVEIRVVLFGQFDACDLINKVLLYGKLYIYKCKYNDVHPNHSNFVRFLEKNSIMP